MEHQNLINDHSKKIESSSMSGNDGHKDTVLDLRSLALGQLLWVRGFKCSWWPAQVVDEKNISENIIVNDRIEGGILVRFYGSYTYSWVDPLADLCKFRESFIKNGSDHVKAFQKSLEEILRHNDVNKPSVELDEKSTIEVSMCQSAKGEESEKTQRQGKLKEKIPKTAKLDEPEQIPSQGKQKEKALKGGKVEVPEKSRSLGKRKEKTPKSVKDEEPEQTRTQGKRKEKVLKREKGQEPVQIESEEKSKEKAPKKARGEEPEQIQSEGKRKEKSRKSAKGEEPVEIESQGKGKGKAPKNVTGREQEKIRSQGKNKEKASSDVSQRSRGKTNEKVPYNAQEMMEDGSEKTVRQIRVMRQLGLAAPAGSPFSV